MFTFIRRYLNRPQGVFLRKAMFQLHLWVGVAATIYVALIGLSGAILVFKPELYRMNHPRPVVRMVVSGSTTIGAGDAILAALATQPGKSASFVWFPRPDAPYFSVVVGRREFSKTVDVDPSTGAVLLVENPNQGWLGIVTNFHYFLLLPPIPGLLLNGIGAAAMLLVALSGAVLWWPGISNWKRGFLVNFKMSFKRVTRDSHNIVGLYALFFISLWAVTGIYFAWPQEFQTAISVFSKATDLRARLAVTPLRGKVLDLNVLIPVAQNALPGEVPLGVFVSGGAPIVLMVRKPGMTFFQSDSVVLDGVRGKVLKIVRQDDPRTFGDRILDLMQPLHFGTQWGLEVKIIYFLAGLAMPFLALTGLMMYWQRYLKKVLIRKPASIGG